MVEQLPACPICSNPALAKTADALIAAGEKDAGVRETLKAIAPTLRVGTASVRRHRETCRNGSDAVARFGASPRRPTDFASMVRDKATELMVAGELAVTTQHGLQAQQMLDARETKEKDRAMMMALARILAGENVPDSLVIVSQQYEVLSDGADMDVDELEMVGP